MNNKNTLKDLPEEQRRRFEFGFHGQIVMEKNLRFRKQNSFYYFILESLPKNQILKNFFYENYLIIKVKPWQLSQPKKEKNWLRIGRVIKFFFEFTKVVADFGVVAVTTASVTLSRLLMPKVNS